MMDASLKKEFTPKAIIFVTITDYPGLFSLSGFRAPFRWSFFTITITITDYPKP
jgi:hypothetical protein